MIKNNKILIVGAGGFIGGHLVKRLLDDGNFVVATDIKPKEYWFQEFETAENYYSMDMKDISNCRKVTKNIDYVFMFAGRLSTMAIMAKYPLGPITENTIINIIVPISIFGINFFLLDVLLNVISQAWMVQSDERKFGNIFLVYGLPYLLWKAVPSFNKETTENNDTETQRRSLLHKRAQKYYYQYGELSLLKLNIKFVLFTFSIFWLTNHLFVMPNLRQYSKVGFDIGLDLLTVILIFSILITIFTSQRNFIWQDKNLAKTNAPINSNNNLEPEILTKEGRAIRDFAEENEDEYFSEEYDGDFEEGEE